MLQSLSLLLFVLSALGLVALLIQALAVRAHLRRPLARPKQVRGVSILKPLCGLDDDLEATLEHFARLPWPELELLLGVKDTDDAAFPIARRIASRFPSRVRVVLQRGAPVMNPKVNQLITLAKAARFDLLMVSDSNALVEADAISELVAHFEDPRVGCVANPVTGRGHQTLGALLDNLHLATFLGPGQIGAKLTSDRDVVIGKSMTLRRDVLEAMGGFAMFGDYAAEDFAIGMAVRHQGLRNVIATSPVWNIAVRRTVRSFFDRYRRWAVLQRTGVTLPTYLAQGLLNPAPLALLGWVLSPSMTGALVVAGVMLTRLATDLWAAKALQLSPRTSAIWSASLVKDALLFLAWAEGLARRTIVWRGNRLEVAEGGRLVRHALSGEVLEGAR